MDLKSWNCYLEELVGAVERRRPVDPSQDPQFIDVKSLVKQQKTLDPQLWDGEKLKPEIVDHLIKIARKFFKSLDIGPDVMIKDITLTGSLASFNWSDYSDVDLHILLDFNQFENPDLIKDLVRNAASNWNNKHDIKIKGYEVEMYVQDANEPHHSLGVFSLQNNRFLKTPRRFNEKIDSGAVKEKANDLMEKIDDIYDIYADQKYDLAEKRADYIIKKIRNYRKAGLEQDGPYSIENLVFKVLRRNGYLEKIINLKTNSYDKRMSINYDTNGLLKEEVKGRARKVSIQKLYSDLNAEISDKNLCIAIVANAIAESALIINNNGDGRNYPNGGVRTSSFPDVFYRPNRYGSNSHCCSFGLFQYHICGGMGREFLRYYGVAPGRGSSDEEKVRVLMSYENQIEYMIQYVKKHPFVKRNIDTGKSAHFWTEWFLVRVERPASVLPGSTPERKQRSIRYRQGLSNKVIRALGGAPEAIAVSTVAGGTEFIGGPKFEHDGTEVYILGDSNTTTHEGYWSVWSRKNFPKSRINFLALGGLKIPTILSQLEKVDPKNTRMVIIGSLGGNDAQGLKDKNFVKELEPGGDYYVNNIEPLMKRLNYLQRNGVVVKFFGLPFGRGSDPNREKARAAMDLALLTAAQEYGVDYTTVFEKTKQIKGKRGGVHYSEDRRRAYRDHLADLIGGKQPLPNEEIAYMKGRKGTGIGRNYFLAPYRIIKKTGFKFKDFYNDLEKVFPGEIGSGKKILPIHGKDYIFGPEHFAAMKLLSKKFPQSKYAEMVRLKTKQRQIKGVASVEQKHEKELS
jgi:hypothetical protein